MWSSSLLRVPWKGLKSFKNLAPREFLGSVYTAQNEMETWHPPRVVVLTTAKKKKKKIEGREGEALASFPCDLEVQNSLQSSRIFLYVDLYIHFSHGPDESSLSSVWLDSDCASSWQGSRLHLVVQTAESPRSVRWRNVWGLDFKRNFLNLSIYFLTPNHLCLWRFAFLEAESRGASILDWLFESTRDLICKAETLLFWFLSWGEYEKSTCFSSKVKRRNPETTKMLGLFVISKLK